MQQAFILSIGTELALGQTVDTNAAWLARELAAIGIRTTRHATLADELPLIVDVLKQTAAEHDLVLVTGGLGPTADDLTRTALAEAAGTDLVEDPDSLARIRAFFAERQREMPARNSVQALRPRTGRSLPNDCGTAPGVHVRIGGTPVYSLPGVPREMRAMFEAQVRPHLPVGRVIRSRILRSFGLGESDLGDRIRDLMQRGRNPEVGTTAAYALVGVRINATAETAPEADALLDRSEAEIRARLGDYVYGRDGETLPGAVLAMLATRGETLVTAESCTGGLVGEMLTDVPGSSRGYRGGVVTYANALKESLLDVPRDTLDTHGAVSEEVARAMADGARRILGGTWALATTGVAGPSGGTTDKPVGLVYIGLAGPDGTTVRRCLFGSDATRAAIRQRAALTALNLVRRRCLPSAED